MELVENSGNVMLDRALRAVQPRRNGRVRVTLDYQLEDLTSRA